MTENVGRPTDLEDDLFRKIKEAILEGKNLREVAAAVGKPESVIYDWSSKNYKGFADKVEGWKRDRKLMLAEKNIEEILTMSTVAMPETSEKMVRVDCGLLRIQADVSKFVAETLGRNNYSKRSELTGKNGESLISLGELFKAAKHE